MLEISKKVVAEARELKLKEPVRKTIYNLVKRSVVVTYPQGNRKRFNYLFKVVNGVVCSMCLVSKNHNLEVRCQSCFDTKKISVFELCNHCEGSGCANCRQQGEVLRKIPCQDCIPKTVNFTQNL